MFRALHFWQQQAKNKSDKAAKLTLIVDHRCKSLYPARIIIAGGHNHGPLRVPFTEVPAMHTS